MNLTLTLKKKWFDMILSGEKKEEYREIKPYWLTRFKYYCNHDDMMHELNYEYTHIIFKNGYSKDAPSFLIELNDIKFGKAKPEWSDNWQGEVFVIKLGAIISTKNIKNG
jgi:hypothetical protein